jgi:hypothetical protein
MGKINDPRLDFSGSAMRYYRANKMYKIIKKTIKKDKKLKDEINLKHDLHFNNNFNELPEQIKEEFIFLWEEVGDLNEKIYLLLNEKSLTKCQKEEEQKQKEEEQKEVFDYSPSNYKRPTIFAP